MKFLLISHDDERHWRDVGDDACGRALGEAVKLAHEIHARGQYILASPLEPAASATNVRVRDGKRLVTDGPYAETREVVGGFYLVDVDSLAEAIEIAARHPGARVGTVEIRQIKQVPGLPAARK